MGDFLLALVALTFLALPFSIAFLISEVKEQQADRRTGRMIVAALVTIGCIGVFVYVGWGLWRLGYYGL